MTDSLSALIVVGAFHARVCELLVDGAISRLTSHSPGVRYEVVKVPGALEIPQALTFAIMSDRERYDGYIALGCVLRGKTEHNVHVARSVYATVGEIAVQHAAPLGTGVITAENTGLALERADKNGMDVGGSAAAAMLRMVELYRRFLV